MTRLSTVHVERMLSDDPRLCAVASMLKTLMLQPHTSYDARAAHKLLSVFEERTVTLVFDVLVGEKWFTKAKVCYNFLPALLVKMDLFSHRLWMSVVQSEYGLFQSYKMSSNGLDYLKSAHFHPEVMDDANSYRQVLRSPDLGEFFLFTTAFFLVTQSRRIFRGPSTPRI